MIPFQTTLLSYKQCLGDEKLDVLSLFGKGCYVTEFARLLGSRMYSSKSDDICPVIPAEVASKLIPNRVSRCNTAQIGQTYLTANYGVYPQNIVHYSTEKKLNKAFREKKILQTGNTYTVNFVEKKEGKLLYTSETLNEYEFEQNRYVRITGKVKNVDWTDCTDELKPIKNGKSYWVQVRPITWLIDEKTGLWISQCALLSGLSEDSPDNRSKDFKESFLNRYLNDVFVRDIHNHYDMAFFQEKLLSALYPVPQTTFAYSQVVFKTLVSYLNKQPFNFQLLPKEEQLTQYAKKLVLDMQKGDKTPNDVLLELVKPVKICNAQTNLNHLTEKNRQR